MLRMLRGDDTELPVPRVPAVSDVFTMIKDADINGLSDPDYQVSKRQRRTEEFDTDHQKHSDAAFLAGRPVEVAFTRAPPVMLLAPEFGLLHDAAYHWNEWIPPHWLYEAASDLLTLMAKIYDRKEERQKAFLAWHSKHMGFDIVHPNAGSTSLVVGNGWLDPDEYDGEHIIQVVGGPSYLVGLLVVKNELKDGDPYYQLQRIVQIFYEKRLWYKDPVIFALGAPLLCLDIVGPNLQIHGMYTLHTNRIVAEALTPRIPLLQQSSRQPRQLDLLAATLGGYLAAVAALAKRIAVACGATEPEIAAFMPLQLRQKATEVVSATTEGLKGLNVHYAAVLEGAVLTKSQVSLLTDLRRRSAPSRHEAVLLLPYTLAACISNTPSSSGRSVTNVGSIPHLLDLESGKLTYTGTFKNKPSFVKFTTSVYPSHVHNAWAAHQLVPQLYSCDNLPGGYSYIVMELLDCKDWQRLCGVLCSSEYTSDDKEGAREAAKAALQQAHAIQVDHDGHTADAVHGDCRGPNIMVRRDNSGWEVRFVDLDWSGLAGIDRYPGRMSSQIGWHPDAKPRRLLQQSHDEYLLESSGHLD